MTTWTETLPTLPTEELLNQLEQATKLADWTNENDTQRESAAKALAAIRTEILNRATK
ncbi:MAG: hypothetical protein E6Y12_07135 [Dermabacter sp.]|nr:hypothetical protein [Dermabacter sp.]